MSVFSAPLLQLTLIQPRNKSHHRVSLNERKNPMQSSGKGHNELLEIAIPLEQTRDATNAAPLRVSENRGARVNHVQHAILELAADSITATNPMQKPTSSQISHFCEKDLDALQKASLQHQI
jgi:hypothetical protein